MMDNIDSLLNPDLLFESSFNAGVDAGINGPNTKNCHFGFFKDSESMKEWERGKRVGEIESLAQVAEPADA